MESNKILDKELLIHITFIFYILSIFLDLHIFYNPISTLIRCLIINILFIFIFFKFGDKKENKFLISYFLAYLLFIILHIYNINNNNLLSETLYFYKMSMSILIIYIVIHLKIDLNNFYKVLNMAKAKLCKCDGQSGSSTPFPSSIPSSIPSETVEPEMTREQINNNIANE